MLPAAPCWSSSGGQVAVIGALTGAGAPPHWLAGLLPLRGLGAPLVKSAAF